VVTFFRLLVVTDVKKGKKKEKRGEKGSIRAKGTALFLLF